jgi:hypothetical protein
MTSIPIQKRMDFCNEALKGSIDWAGDVIITDESRFGLYDDSRRLWVQRGTFRDSTTKPKPKFQKSFMCWGAVGKGYKSQGAARISCSRTNPDFVATNSQRGISRAENVMLEPLSHAIPAP